MTPTSRRRLLLFALVVLSGCASLHGLEPRSSPRDANSLAAERALAAAPLSAAAWPRAEWWKSFGDPQLDALMDEALAGSPTLRIAEARTRKALAAANAGRAALLPRVDGNLSTTRERFPEAGLVPPPYGGTWQTLDQLQANITWQLDLWGRNREAYAGTRAAARAAEIDAHAARLALASAIAQAYVELQRDFLQLDVAQTTLEERERLHTLTVARKDAGLDSQVEVKQALAAIPATRVQVAQLTERIALARNQIAALMGAGPDRGLSIERPAANALAPIAIPSAIPAELLGRRPDVVAQRWRVEAARHDIASAKAEFYPNVELTAFAGLQTLVPGSFLAAASRTLGAGPAFTLPIFEGGRLRANLAGKDADYDIAVEQYNQAIANALREVVDQLASLRSVKEQRAQEQAALAASRDAYELASLRYRAGIGNYLQVLSAQQPLLAQRSLEADLQARELELAINLVRALGGGIL